MRFWPGAFCAAALLVTAEPACATWFRCVALGNSDAGVTHYLTTAAQLPGQGDSGIKLMRDRLVNYVHGVDPALSQVTAQCATYAEQEEATTSFNAELDTQSRKLGWDHIVVVLPGDWIPAGRVKTDRTRP